MIKVIDYTDTPGGRYAKDGAYSGEEYREKILKIELQNAEKLEIDLDGTFGYPASFLEEAFGGLVRELGKDVIQRLTFISNEDPSLIKLIHNYMKNA